MCGGIEASGTSRRFSRPVGDERGDERRAERQVGQLRLAADHLDSVDDASVRVSFAFLPAERDPDLLVRERAVPGHEHHRVAADRELAPARATLGRLE